MPPGHLEPDDTHTISRDDIHLNERLTRIENAQDSLAQTLERSQTKVYEALDKIQTSVHTIEKRQSERSNEVTNAMNAVRSEMNDRAHAQDMEMAKLQNDTANLRARIEYMEAKDKQTKDRTWAVITPVLTLILTGLIGAGLLGFVLMGGGN